MDNTWKKILVVLTFGVAIMLSACNGNQDNALDPNNSGNTDINNVSHKSNVNDPSIIPSETGDKTYTTNKNGTNYNGMGNDTYSSIGSSGIHEGGLSSFLESILEGEGITGVKVFAIDDSVILARKQKEMTSHKYDDMQNNVLSGTKGMSGKGEPKGIPDKKKRSNDNLDQAREKLTNMFNGNVKIFTVTNKKAPALINGIKDKIKSGSFQAASDDLLTLLNMTK